MLTGGQLRMARAALQITVEETAALAGVDKGTIVRIEGGKNAYANTLRAIRSALENQGLVFIEAAQGIHGPTVAFRWDVDEQRKRSDLKGGDATGDGNGINSRAWDEDLGAPAMPDADRASLRRYYEDHPERWARLSPAGKAVLGRAIGAECR